VAVRNNIPAKEWTNPSNCQHQQAFVDISSDQAGLTVANLGLNEYEVLRDGRNTIAVTLLRSVAELGDWGVFPTPEAQCLGEHTVEFEIIPHGGNGIASGAFAEAYQYQIPWTVRQTGIHGGDLPTEHSFLQWSGTSLALSAVKIAEETGDLIVRWFNMARESERLTLSPPENVGQLYKSNVIEERLEPIALDGSGKVSLEVGPCRIVTVAMELP